MAKYSASQARANFNAVMEQAKSEPVEIHKHGKPSVVILDAMTYEKLVAYIEDLEDTNTVLNYEIDPESFGTTISLEEVERELGLKPLRS
jgi:prevent-host-death family protein